jgi:DNA-binding NarL/FixJ family response regulator
VTIRVLIADDHPVFLDGLRLLLDSTPGLQVVGAASDGNALVDLADRTPCDVVVADLDMPGLDGAAATRELLSRKPDLAVLVLTMHDDDESVHRALRAGARGYVLKGAAQGAIARAIHALAEGDTVLHGSIAGRVVQAANESRPSTAFPTLSSREVEVLELVARGMPNQAVAERLFLSVKTVQNRVSDLLAKTGSRTRAELVARARDAGLGGAGQ